MNSSSLLAVGWLVANRNKSNLIIFLCHISKKKRNCYYKCRLPLHISILSFLLYSQRMNIDHQREEEEEEDDAQPNRTR